jgi:hypothetical protein
MTRLELKLPPVAMGLLLGAAMWLAAHFTPNLRCFVLLGWAVHLGHLLAFMLAMALVTLMNRLQIIPEERALAAKFGPAFTAYKSKVRRWL